MANAPQAPNPLDNEELFDVITVAGVRSPGRVSLSGHDREIGWDVKKGPGQSGATTTRTSEDPVAFVASFYLATLEDINAWPDFLQLLRTTISGATPKALDIYHPDLSTNDIRSIVLKKVGGVVHDGKGGQTIAVTLLEYRPPKPKGGTPKGAATKPENDPDAAAKAELKKLTDQFQKTPWG